MEIIVMYPGLRDQDDKNNISRVSDKYWQKRNRKLDIYLEPLIQLERCSQYLNNKLDLLNKKIELLTQVVSGNLSVRDFNSAYRNAIQLKIQNINSQLLRQCKEVPEGSQRSIFNKHQGKLQQLMKSYLGFQLIEDELVGTTLDGCKKRLTNLQQECEEILKKKDEITREKKKEKQLYEEELNFQVETITREKQHSLIQACEQGELTKVKQLVEERYFFEEKDYINGANEHGQGVLHVLSGTYNQDDTEITTHATEIASFNRCRMEIAEFLIDHGACVDLRNNQGYTALHIASKVGDEALVSLLIKNGADVNARGEYERTPLNMAAYSGHINIVSLLLEKGADAERKTNEKDGAVTALHNAAMNGYLDIVELLIQHGSELNSRDNRGNTPLVYAMMSGYLKVTEFLSLKGGVIAREGELQLADLLKNAQRSNHVRMFPYLVKKSVEQQQIKQQAETQIKLKKIKTYSRSKLQQVKKDMEQQIVTGLEKRALEQQIVSEQEQTLAYLYRSQKIQMRYFEFKLNIQMGIKSDFRKQYIREQEAKAWGQVAIALRLAAMDYLLSIIEILTTNISNLAYSDIETSSEVVIEEPDRKYQKVFSISQGFARAFFQGKRREFKEGFDEKVAFQKKNNQEKYNQVPPKL